MRFWQRFKIQTHLQQRSCFRRLLGVVLLPRLSCRGGRLSSRPRALLLPRLPFRPVLLEPSSRPWPSAPSSATMSWLSGGWEGSTNPSMAYIHTLLSLRLPSLAPEYLSYQDLDPGEVKRELGDLVPFLLDPASSVRYESARAAWGAVWEAIGQLDGAQDPKTLVFLLEMVAKLFHPPITTDAPKATGVLDDLYGLLATQRPAAVAKKVVFYAAAMAQVPRDDWVRIETEVLKEVERLKGEMDQTGTPQERPVPLLDNKPSAAPKIELLD